MTPTRLHVYAPVIPAMMAGLGQTASAYTRTNHIATQTLEHVQMVYQVPQKQARSGASRRARQINVMSHSGQTKTMVSFVVIARFLSTTLTQRTNLAMVIARQLVRLALGLGRKTAILALSSMI
jgi:hypothetical protein